MNIVQARKDRSVLGFAFSGDSWRTWFCSILAGAFGLRMNATDADTFRRLANREPMTKAVRELWIIAGRRSGKTNVASAVAVYLATLKRWHVSIGETATVMVLASDRAQAAVSFRYCLGLLEASPVLAAEVESTTNDSIRLRSGIEIVIATSDKAAVRGRTLIAVICDEVAFWGSEADEVLTALRPAMATQPDAMLIAISTAYSQRGPLFDAFRRYYGTDDPKVLVIKAATRDLNPNISEEFIAAELARDPQAAAAEYLAEFRSDLAALLDAALVDRATRSEPRELPYRLANANGTQITYRAGLDVSGGRNDSTACAIVHREGDSIITDAVRHWPAPHDPAAVAREVAAFLRSYKLTNATADQYGAELTRTIYADAGVSIQPSELNRSELYLALQPLFSSSRIEIPDDPRLRTELLGLERRVGRSGKDSVDHRPGQHDDLSNSLACATWTLAKQAVAPDGQCIIYLSTALSGYADTFGDSPAAEGYNPTLGHFGITFTSDSGDF